MSLDTDNQYMQIALRLARRGLGQVWPNPAVGCVIVKDGRVVGRGRTQPGGRPHAETEAIARAGGATKSATAYVTLEPCAHRGQTPPCAEALVTAGIVRVVIAIRDPDERVAGKGIATLRQAGIEVDEGVLDAEAADLNVGFLFRITQNRPFVGLKVATTLDGAIATNSRHSQWITGPEARARVQLLRSQHDAVLTGIGTVLADDPILNCRLPGRRRQPVRVVMDSRLRTPSDCQLVRSAGDIPLWIMSASDDPASALKPAEVITIAGEEGSGRVAPLAVLQKLAERGITRVMIEAGAEIAASFLRVGLVDQLYWFRGTKIVGGDGLSVFDHLGIDRLDQAIELKQLSSSRVGKDLFEIFAVQA